MAHRDLASRIHVRNAAESGQTRTDVNDPQQTSRFTEVDQIVRMVTVPRRLRLAKRARNTHVCFDAEQNRVAE
jgi:hypothetical protein